MSDLDTRHITDLLSDNEKFFNELRSVVAQLKICVEALTKVSDEYQGQSCTLITNKALSQVDKKYK